MFATEWKLSPQQDVGQHHTNPISTTKSTGNGSLRRQLLLSSRAEQINDQQLHAKSDTRDSLQLHIGQLLCPDLEISWDASRVWVEIHT
jgi:hypothetical protein